MPTLREALAQEIDLAERDLFEFGANVASASARVCWRSSTRVIQAVLACRWVPACSATINVIP